MNKDIVLQFNQHNASVVEENIVIDKFDKIFIFEEFESGLLRLFDGVSSLKAICDHLQNIYINTYVETEFLDFVYQMIEKEILIEVV